VAAPRTPRGRKYGGRHQTLRKQLAPHVEAGLTLCSRCGRRIDPGERWELDRVDGAGPDDYAGPAHLQCNRQTATHRAVRERAMRDQPPMFVREDGQPASRQW
jgi:hypothetical protein